MPCLLYTYSCVYETAAGFSYLEAKVLYGVYGKAQTLFNLPAAFITPLTISIVPAISSAIARGRRAEAMKTAEAVSYTHLDVYKRQELLHWRRKTSWLSSKRLTRTAYWLPPMLISTIKEEAWLSATPGPSRDLRDFPRQSWPRIRQAAELAKYTRLRRISRAASVSYTHLDVYKRQPLNWLSPSVFTVQYV